MGREENEFLYNRHVLLAVKARHSRQVGFNSGRIKLKGSAVTQTEHSDVLHVVASREKF